MRDAELPDACAQRLREEAMALLNAVEAQPSVETAADAAEDVHATVTVLVRVLQALAAGCAEDGEAAARELARCAAELSAVAKRMGAAVEAVEGEVASRAPCGQPRFVVRHVSYGHAVSVDVAFLDNAADARAEALRLAADVPIGDVVQLARYRPDDLMPAPALVSYAGRREMPDSAV
jgi:hypothetical protein